MEANTQSRSGRRHPTPIASRSNHQKPRSPPGLTLEPEILGTIAPVTRPSRQRRRRDHWDRRMIRASGFACSPAPGPLFDGNPI